MTQTKKKKGIESVKGYKVQSKLIERPSNQSCFSDVFELILHLKKNSTYPYSWVYFFAPHLTRQRKFILCGIFFQIAEIPQGHALEYTLRELLATCANGLSYIHSFSYSEQRKMY